MAEPGDRCPSFRGERGSEGDLVYVHIFSLKPLNEYICNLIMPKLRGSKFILYFDFVFCSNMFLHFVNYHSYLCPSWGPHDPFCAFPQRQRPLYDTTNGPAQCDMTWKKSWRKVFKKVISPCDNNRNLKEQLKFKEGLT